MDQQRDQLSTRAAVNIRAIPHFPCSPKDLCYTPKHYRLMMVATAGLLMYIFTMWVMFFMVMRLLRRRRSFGE